ncbi:hypothetical protein C7140_12030 [Neisseria gonorrhoeae]
MLEFRETYESSFPCRRESGISMPQEFIGKNQNPSAVIPTFVGMTWCRFPCGWIRHSRAGGNPVRSVSVISDKFLLLFISRFPLPWE